MSDLPSIDEAFDQPSSQPVGRRIAKNLHIVIPMVVVGFLATVMVFRTADDSAKIETAKQERIAQEIKSNASAAAAPSEATLDEEIARQKKDVAQEQVSALDALTPKTGQPQLKDPVGVSAADNLPAVPQGTPQVEQDPEAAQRQAKRLEQIRSAPLIKIRADQSKASLSQVASVGGLAGLAAAQRTSGVSPEATLARMRQEAEHARNAARDQGDQLIKLGKANLAQARRGERPVVVAGSGSGATADANWYSQVEAQGGSNQRVTLAATIPGPVIHQGTVIPAVLLTELNSDLPGQISAMVTMDVYDSVRGDDLMIPKGSRLVGSYNNDVRIGQERAMAAFTRIIRPDGSAMNLGAMPGADGNGQAGLSDEVDNHFWKMFSSSFLMAGISFLADKAAPDTVVVNSSTQSPQASAGEILKDISQTILERDTRVQPTIRVHKGHRFNVLVNKDITIPAVR